MIQETPGGALRSADCRRRLKWWIAARSLHYQGWPPGSLRSSPHLTIPPAPANSPQHRWLWIHRIQLLIRIEIIPDAVTHVIPRRGELADVAVELRLDQLQIHVSRRPVGK